MIQFRFKYDEVIIVVNLAKVDILITDNVWKFWWKTSETEIN